MKRTLVPVLLVALSGVSAALAVPVRNGVPFPGYDAVTIGLGGFRSVGFGDPMCLLSNPACISMRQGNSLLSLSAGPVISDIAFRDGTESHSDSWTIGLGDYSVGMKFPVLDEMGLGFAVSRTAVLPLRTIYYIPESFNGGGTSEGSVEVKGEFSELALGCSWDAADWLSIGAAAGARLTSQTFDPSYAGTSGLITHINYQESDLSFKAGVAIPLEQVTFGLAWEAEGSFAESRLSIGGAFDFTRDIKMGPEVEVASLDERNVYIGRMFGSVYPSGSMALRGGIFFNSATEAISRQGLGFSLGAGYEIGEFTVNGAFSWSPLKGDRDYYGYSGLESFSGTSSVVSVGIDWGRAAEAE